MARKHDTADDFSEKSLSAEQNIKHQKKAKQNPFYKLSTVLNLMFIIIEGY